MREIKFRAWDANRKRMVTNGIVVCDGKAYLDHRDFEDAIQSGNYLMQFTGLKDKNGKEIYEGDVVKDSAGDVLFVSFEEGAFWFCYSTENRFTYDHAVKHGWWTPIEVIGNIYENKDLLAKGSMK